MIDLLAYDQGTGTVHSRPGRVLVPATFYAAPIRAIGVKGAWVIDPAAFTVSPGWA